MHLRELTLEQYVGFYLTQGPQHKRKQVSSNELQFFCHVFF